MEVKQQLTQHDAMHLLSYLNRLDESELNVNDSRDFEANKLAIKLLDFAVANFDEKTATYSLGRLNDLSKDLRQNQRSHFKTMLFQYQQLLKNTIDDFTSYSETQQATTAADLLSKKVAELTLSDVVEFLKYLKVIPPTQ